MMIFTKVICKGFKICISLTSPEMGNGSQVCGRPLWGKWALKGWQSNCDSWVACNFGDHLLASASSARLPPQNSVKKIFCVFTSQTGSGYILGRACTMVTVLLILTDVRQLYRQEDKHIYIKIYYIKLYLKLMKHMICYGKVLSGTK